MNNWEFLGKDESEGGSILSIHNTKKKDHSIKSVSIHEASSSSECDENFSLHSYEPVKSHKCKCIII
jgi:hypothetical protein